MSPSHSIDSLQDDEAMAKALLRRPEIAWPTVALAALSFCLYGFSTAMGVLQQWPVALTVFINSLSTYWLFTVGHDSSHNAVSLKRWLNDGLGRLSSVVLLPLPMFRMFRFVHMQHHRYSNEPDDPDYWVGKGAWWSVPLRCAFVDLHYVVWYLKRASSRPRDELIDNAVSGVVGVAVLGTLVASGWGRELLLFWLLPSRIAVFVLALAFDFLPHMPYKATDAENKYMATSVRVGQEWLLTPLLLFQNYHLVHHLYPVVPFYRYIRLWRARERFHLSHKPLIVNMAQRELSQDEYCAVRQSQR
jgi:beta-carotene hydroxylase